MILLAKNILNYVWPVNAYCTCGRHREPGVSATVNHNEETVREASTWQTVPYSWGTHTWPALTSTLLYSPAAELCEHRLQNGTGSCFLFIPSTSPQTFPPLSCLYVLVSWIRWQKSVPQSLDSSPPPCHRFPLTSNLCLLKVWSPTAGFSSLLPVSFPDQLCSDF